MFCCELSEDGYDVTAPCRRGDLDGVVDFYLSYAPRNIQNLNREFIITGSAKLGPAWAERIKVSKQFITTLLHRFTTRLEQVRARELRLPARQGEHSPLSDSDVLARADKLMKAGKQVPLDLEEHCLQIHLRNHPERTDLVQRLCTVLMEQGKRVPLFLEEMSLQAHLADSPDRDDLRERLRIVQVAMGKLKPPAPYVGASGEQASQSDVDFQQEAENFNRRASFNDMDSAFLPIMDLARRYTMTSVERMYALYESIRYIEAARIPGAICECGVWRGGSIMVALATLKLIGSTERDIYLFDTFEGLPRPDETVDVDMFGNNAFDGWIPHARSDKESNWAYASIDDVMNNVEKIGYPKHRIHLVKGMVEETLPSKAPSKIALLRLDTDWYSSTRHELTTLYPKLERHGVLLIDDYGHFLGARRAVDEYFATYHSPPLLTRVDYSGRLAIKI